MSAEQGCAELDDFAGLDPERWVTADELWEPDDRSEEELAAWFGELAAAAASDDAAETAWRASRVIEEDLANATVSDLMAAARAAGGDVWTMTDAEVIGSAVKWQEVACRAQGRMFRAMEELLRRRRPRKWDRRNEQADEQRDEQDGIAEDPTALNRVRPAVMPSREAAEELALALTCTEYGAEALVSLTADLSRRLPRTFGELEAGRADLDRVKIISEYTRYLSDEDAGKVDALLAPRLGQMTTGELRDEARRAMIRIDPAAAERRRKRNERKARVSLYANGDHTATLAIVQAPAPQAAAAKARINAIARAAKSAGAAEPTGLLEAKVAVGLLLGTLPQVPPPCDGPGGDGPRGDGPGTGGPGYEPDPDADADPWDLGWPGTPPDDTGGPYGDSEPYDDRPPGEPVRAGPGPEDSGMAWPAIPDASDAAAPGCAALPAWLRPNAAGRARVMVPWRTLAGMAAESGELSWFGPVTPAQARELARAAAGDPAVRWHLVVTGNDGRAVAITTLRPRRGRRPPGMVDEVTITIAESLAAALDSNEETRERTRQMLARLDPAGRLADVLDRAIGAAIQAAAQAALQTALDEHAGGCAHTLEVPGYRVPGMLRRWLNTRDRTCRNPICRRRAVQCDQDHTLAYDQGGRTCACNLGSLCRVHHQLKQLPGWHLSQDAESCFTWRTPAGLTYRKEPYRYAA